VTNEDGVEELWALGDKEIPGVALGAEEGSADDDVDGILEGTAVGRTVGPLEG
jgi:hypothetical protein